MRKTCKDPVCPANKHPPSTSKAREIRTKKPKRKRSVTVSEAPKPQRKKSKCCRSKKRTKDPDQISHPKICKNKKCAASKMKVTCSASTCSPQMTCVRSKQSVKFCKSGSFCCRSKPVKRTACRCSSTPRSRTKKRKEEKCSRLKCCKRRESNRKNKVLTSLCTCVKKHPPRKAKSCKCAPQCTILSKYDECCCNKSEKNRNKRKEDRTSKEGKLKKQCRCVDSSTKISQNIFARGLSSVRQKLRNIKLYLFRREKSA